MLLAEIEKRLLPAKSSRPMRATFGPKDASAAAEIKAKTPLSQGQVFAVVEADPRPAVSTLRALRAIRQVLA